MAILLVLLAMMNLLLQLLGCILMILGPLMNAFESDSGGSALFFMGLIIVGTNLVNSTQLLKGPPERKSIRIFLRVLSALGNSTYILIGALMLVGPETHALVVTVAVIFILSGIGGLGLPYCPKIPGLEEARAASQ